jgi:hypothetical protein
VRYEEMAVTRDESYKSFSAVGLRQSAFHYTRRLKYVEVVGE